MQVVVIWKPQRTDKGDNNFILKSYIIERWSIENITTTAYNTLRYVDLQNA